MKNFIQDFLRLMKDIHSEAIVVVEPEHSTTSIYFTAAIEYLERAKRHALLKPNLKIF